jgi:hypothetical protein
VTKVERTYKVEERQRNRLQSREEGARAKGATTARGLKASKHVSDDSRKPKVAKLRMPKAPKREREYVPPSHSARSASKGDKENAKGSSSGLGGAKRPHPAAGMFGSSSESEKTWCLCPDGGSPFADHVRALAKGLLRAAAPSAEDQAVVRAALRLMRMHFAVWSCLARESASAKRDLVRKGR